MPEAESRGLWAGLKAAGRAIASFQADFVLTAVYYLALGPASLALKLSGRNPFGAADAKTGWKPREPVDPAEHLKSQG